MLQYRGDKGQMSKDLADISLRAPHENKSSVHLLEGEMQRRFTYYVNKSNLKLIEEKEDVLE